MVREVNEKGNLVFGGLDVTEIAKEYKTPCYVMDEEIIRENCRKYKNSIDNFYDGNGLCCYASKAFSCKEIYRIIESEGLGTDVVSMGELYTAMQVGFNPENICYHGNNKSYEELVYAVDCGVKRIVCDAFDEIDMLDEIANEKGKIQTVLLRVSPGVEAHTHEFIKTGSVDSKFGFAVETGDADKAVEKVLSKNNLKLLGIECHIGSQIFDLEPFKLAAEVMLQFYKDVEIKFGYKLSDLNLGGGFGSYYTDEDKPISYEKYMEAVSVTIKESCKKLDLELPFIMIEPGRSIVCEAGITLYTVGNIKEIKDVRTYVTVDGGMTDNIRFALYGAKYDFNVANKMNEEKSELVTIAGRCCESGDLLAKDIMLQKAERGDIIVVFSTGAYNYSMASNYNRVGKLPVIMIKDKKIRLAVKRETLSDIIRNDV